MNAGNEYLTWRHEVSHCLACCFAFYADHAEEGLTLYLDGVDMGIEYNGALGSFSALTSVLPEREQKIAGLAASLPMGCVDEVMFAQLMADQSAIEQIPTISDEDVALYAKSIDGMRPEDMSVAAKAWTATWLLMNLNGGNVVEKLFPIGEEKQGTPFTLLPPFVAAAMLKATDEFLNPKEAKLAS